MLIHPLPLGIRHILREQTRLQGRSLDAIHQLQGPRPQRRARGVRPCEAVEMSVALGRSGYLVPPCPSQFANGSNVAGFICYKNVNK